MDGARVQKKSGGKPGPAVWVPAAILAVLLAAYLGLCGWVSASDTILPLSLIHISLGTLEGVASVKADLEGKCATVTLTGAVSDQSLTDAVTEAGYEVVSIQ